MQIRHVREEWVMDLFVEAKVEHILTASSRNFIGIGVYSVDFASENLSDHTTQPETPPILDTAGAEKR